MTDIWINIIVIAILIVIIGGAIAYIVKEKKKGVRCIGCPAAGTCARSGGKGNAGSCGGCGTSSDEHET